MVNTVVQTTLLGAADTPEVVRHIHVISDGTQETNTVIYNNASFAADVKKGRLCEMYINGKVTGAIRLNWDQTTPFKAFSLGAQGDTKINLRPFGGVANPGGAGATGNLTLTTTGLAVADEFVLVVVIKQ